jgi:hypothetical protein
VIRLAPPNGVMRHVAMTIPGRTRHLAGRLLRSDPTDARNPHLSACRTRNRRDANSVSDEEMSAIRLIGWKRTVGEAKALRARRDRCVALSPSPLSPTVDCIPACKGGCRSHSMPQGGRAVTFIGRLARHPACSRREVPAQMRNRVSQTVTKRWKVWRRNSLPSRRVHCSFAPAEGARSTPVTASADTSRTMECMDTLRCTHCNTPLPPQPATGRRRRYCSSACRSAAHRARAGSFEPMTQPAVSQPSGEIELLLAGRGADTDEQIAAAILEAQALAAVFTRLGRQARPTLGWRCALVGQDIHDTLVHYFEEALS